MRKADLIQLCEKHNDCVFLAFTNGTLIDEKFADEMLRVKNFVPAISLEGDESATDGRRGSGVFGKATHAMELLHEKKLLYGISSCYTRANYKSITSDEYYQSLIDMGAYFIWYFHYMPVGNDAAPELLPNPEQREYVYLASGSFVQPVHCSPWTSRMTLSLWTDALPVENGICISMQTRGCRSLRVYPLFQCEYPGMYTAGGTKKPHLYGLS